MPSAPSDSTVRDPVLIRVGEIFLKGRNRGTFLRRLAKNLRRAVADIEGTSVEPLHLRPVVWHPRSARADVLSRLHRVFGVQALAPAKTVEPTLEGLTEGALELASRIPEGATFKVKSNRRDKSFPLRSPELSATIGSSIYEKYGLPVDVKNPQHVVHVEVGVERSFVGREWQKGPGGLPVGCSGHLSLLLSGGIDSPLAGWSTMRRGCTLSAVYFHSPPFTGPRTRDKVLRLAELLTRWHGPIAVSVVPFTDTQKQIKESRRQDLVILMYRRMMMRTACALAQKCGAKALVTGENLGQVASQTIENLGVIEAASTLPILRPLLTLDKVEIMEKARAIGTYDTSIEPYEDSCSLFVPKNPATRARRRDLEQAEEGLDVETLVAEMVESSERVIVGRK